MARPKKEKELLHQQIMLRLTDIKYELISTNTQNAQLPLAEYARKQLMNKKVIVKYEIVADPPEIKELITEFGKIGSNLIQIARLNIPMRRSRQSGVAKSGLVAQGASE